MSAEDVVKRCGCGRAFTQAAWDALPDANRYTLEWGEVQEQRRCPCGSHLVVVVTPEPEPRDLDGDPESR